MKSETAKVLNYKPVRLLVLAVVSVSILVSVIESYTDFYEFGKTIASVSLFFIFLSGVPYFLQALLMAYRFKLCFKRIGVPLSYKNALVYHLLGMFFSDFSAGRTGYLAASLPVKTEFEKSLGVVSAISAVDAIAKGFMAMASILIFSILYSSPNVVWLGVVFSLFWIVVGVMFLLYVWKDWKMPEKLVSRIPRYGKTVTSFVYEWKKSMRELKSFTVVIFLFPIAGLVFRGLEWSILAYACGFYLTVSFAMLIHPMLTVLRMIPVTLSGLGVFELALVSLLPGLPTANLIAFGLLDMINGVPYDLLGFLSFKGESRHSREFH